MSAALIAGRTFGHRLQEESDSRFCHLPCCRTGSQRWRDEVMPVDGFAIRASAPLPELRADRPIP